MKDIVKIFKEIRQHLMTGVSHMIPFVIAGGILLSLAVVLGGKGSVPENPILKDIFDIGVAGFELMIPMLAAYIGYSIAGRSALAPAAIAGLVGNKIGAGFLGALFAGIIGGIVVFYLKKIKVPDVFRSIMPIFVMPLIGTFITAGIMMWVIGKPIANVTVLLTEWLQNMSGTNTILLAVILGMMIAFDMGGPVNKVAFSFMILSVSEQIYTIPAMIGVAICVPPIGLGISTLIAPKKYSDEEKETGKAAILMGLVGVTEGAIPFAAANPLRVIPALMAGAACGSVTAGLLGAKLSSSWGGLIVLPTVENKIGYIIAVLVGASVTAVTAAALKKSEAKEAVSDTDDIELEIEF